MFVKTFIEKPQSFRDNVRWTSETKVELFGNAVHQLVYRQGNETHMEKNYLPTVGSTCGAALLPLVLEELYVSKE